jgi:hypothetical protein
MKVLARVAMKLQAGARPYIKFKKNFGKVAILSQQ